MAMFDAIRWTTRGLVSSTCRPTVIGLENVPKEGPFIVAPNHLSFLDSVIVQALMPRPVAFFAKAEYFTTGGVKGKAMKSFFEAVGLHPGGTRRAGRQRPGAQDPAGNPRLRQGRRASTRRAPAPGTASSTAAAPAWAGWP